MKKYLVYFDTKSGDYDKEWCYADSPEEAAEIIKHDLWNVDQITLIREIE